LEKEGLGQLIKMTSALCLILGIMGGGFLYLPPSNLEATRQTAREPANFEKPPEENTKSSHEENLTLETIEVKCQGQSNVSVPYYVHQVRLMGTSCNQHNSGVKITNATTGIEATVFLELNHQYSSDLIQLRTGENTIELSQVPLSKSLAEPATHSQPSQSIQARTITFTRAEAQTAPTGL
jgi:hypothetical protein